MKPGRELKFMSPTAYVYGDRKFRRTMQDADGGMEKRSVPYKLTAEKRTAANLLPF